MRTHLTLNTMLAALLVATTFACSGDPEGDDPVIINIDDDAGHNGDPHQDTGSVGEDASTSNPDFGRGEDVAEAPDAPPDMPPEPSGTACQTKDVPVRLANTCYFEWGTCSDGVEYRFDCNIQNIAGNIFSLCNCFENGVMDEADKIVDICGLADWADIEAVVNEQCGWDLR